mmetsp:Transcript_127144/g.354037  ORF Transcript_127144/g.354037 Transcript_127144/m.354037 type:complete len:113 (+) Transcript_127144:74-412(+)
MGRLHGAAGMGAAGTRAGAATRASLRPECQRRWLGAGGCALVLLLTTLAPVRGQDAAQVVQPDSGEQAENADCQEKCMYYPTLCKHIDFCLSSCNLAEVQRENCKKWESNEL